MKLDNKEFFILGLMHIGEDRLKVYLWTVDRMHVLYLDRREAETIAHAAKLMDKAEETAKP